MSLYPGQTITRNGHAYTLTGYNGMARVSNRQVAIWTAEDESGALVALDFPA